MASEQGNNQMMATTTINQSEMLPSIWL